MKLYRLVIKDKKGKVKVIERNLTSDHFIRLEESLHIPDVNGYILLRIDVL